MIELVQRSETSRVSVYHLFVFYDFKIIIICCTLEINTNIGLLLNILGVPVNVLQKRFERTIWHRRMNYKIYPLITKKVTEHYFGSCKQTGSVQNSGSWVRIITFKNKSGSCTNKALYFAAFMLFFPRFKSAAKKEDCFI